LQFTKLRLTGFKSFTDATEFVIGPGLTGIVGPNGCGKSNLVEALQWVMGEASARRLRGAEMDDVIFGGTSTRPARNLAAVTLSLDNADRSAPAGFNDSDEIEIERRIERGKGSTYRVNGRELRARDVQLLFADAASGAHSTALIGQGRIGWLINAKPSERRSILEDAAGVSGLQARRHEAELRLSAAETNLVRLKDIAENLVAQIERLRKQSRQAERYRRLSEQIRLAEALLLYRLWFDQQTRRDQAAARLTLAEASVAAARQETARAETAHEQCQAALPNLRTAAAESAQGVERLNAGLLVLEAEAKRLAQSTEDWRRRSTHLDQDLARERQLGAEAAAALARLDVEAKALAARAAGSTGAAEAATAQRDAAQQAIASAEAALAETQSGLAARAAEANALARRREAAEERRARLAKEAGEAAAKLQHLDLLSVPPARLAEADSGVTDAESAQALARHAAETAAEAARAAEAEVKRRREPVADHDRRRLTLDAEIEGLKRVAATATGKGATPLLDRITVTPGLEAALAAALGDDLAAALDEDAPICWRDLGAEAEPTAPLPAGAEALAPAIAAPPALARRLARIGLVADAETGSRLQRHLRPGQRLVTRDGAAWRWDGLRRAAGAPSAAAIRLAQRNRLATLEATRAELVRDGAAAASALADAQRRQAAAEQDQRRIQAELQQAGLALGTARQALAALAQQQAQAELRRQSSLDAQERLTQEQAELSASAEEIERELAALPDLGAVQQTLQRQRNDLARLRDQQSAAQRELDQLLREAMTARARLEAIAVEAEAWRRRVAQAGEHEEALEQRRVELVAEGEALAARPQALATEQAALLTELDGARRTRDAAAAALHAAERQAGEADRARREAEAKHAAEREQLVRAEAALEQAAEALAAASARARENFDCPAEQLPRVAGIPPTPIDEAASLLTQRFDKLRLEREALGPVNLTAETELAALTQEHATIVAESADLVAAIAKLRQGIQQLNREGAERLQRAFDAVNLHFQELFVRLFAGGGAHLELVENDDPFAAGIEIMASPPGKKLQILSLLSGGERALTALALVFAVFLTNPAPISVLDEVDAPLDDANVERFCRLVREIGERTGTRFLIITHHRVSMAVMDRLYGVTMMEKGVSRLVSVELAAAQSLRRSA
jgi:chromosome segregation protein